MLSSGSTILGEAINNNINGTQTNRVNQQLANNYKQLLLTIS